MSLVRLTDVREGPVPVEECRAAVADPACGAVVVFAGSVRDHAGERAVQALEYSAHPSARAVLAALTERVGREQVERTAEPRRAVRGLAVVHRIGLMDLGEPTIVVAASAAHRDEAFEACRALLEAVTREIPVWKRQLYRDGTQEWVGAPPV